ncbi:hypothetical protein Tco_0660140 [Tanacetum coccineum]
MGLGYPKGSGFELTAFSDADHAGCLDTRKSTSGGIQFLGDKIVSWMSKKQNCTAMSSAEAEYVALSASCAQVMWMRTQLQDYGFNYNKISCYCVSQFSLSALSCNPCAALPYQAYPYSFTKALPDERFSISSEGIGMEMFDSSRLEGRMPTKIELTLEQSQQGVSNDVLEMIGRLNQKDSNYLIHSYRVVCFETFRYQVYQGRLLASFQDDAKYEHVGQDTRSQGGKDDQDKRIKI